MNFKVFNYEIIEFLCDLIIILKFENVKREENVSFRNESFLIGKELRKIY